MKLDRPFHRRSFHRRFIAGAAGLCCALLSLTTPALAGDIAPAAAPLKTTEPVRDRNFPLFMELESRAGKALLRDAQALQALAGRQLNSRSGP